MKVLLVANTLPPHDLSGAGEQVVQLADGLRERGVEVRLLGRGQRGARGPKTLFPLTVLSPLLRELRQWRPDVVQIHESDGGLVPALLRLRRRLGHDAPLLVCLQQVSYVEERRAVRPLRDLDRAGAPVVATPTRDERRFRRWRTPLQILLGRWSARAADLVLTPSVQTGRELVRDYGIEEFHVLPNVTAAGRAAASPATGDPTTEEEPYLLFVGRLRLRKGVELLLEALGRWPEVAEGPPPRTLLVGDGERREALERAIDRLGLDDRVLLVGRQDPAAIGGWLARARALVVPSTYEGMPLVVLEAMAASLPVVASAVSGIPEVVVDGESGWLVEPERSRALSEALARAWLDPEEARRRGVAGRERLDRYFRPEHAARIWLQAVGECRERATTGPRRSAVGG